MHFRLLRFELKNWHKREILKLFTFCAESLTISLDPVHIFIEALFRLEYTRSFLGLFLFGGVVGVCALMPLENRFSADCDNGRFQDM
ncbi:hypothetical protein Nepgr_004066 [Nepenthes gracilis]|uniref:Uncharacterized protein n=1 Tax=Nepenthes gracilis TaxID=150966 RepID=A0AAD3S0V8_NEPGR|nr:hypothetical protein Nepgr_004066 [Nepenthes gracilis]